MAYVVILHLSPDHDSSLAQVLQSVTKMAVAQVTEKIKIEPNHVYVIPPDKHLTVKDGFVLVSSNTQIEDRRAPIDIFFRTLAEEHGAGAIAVILSGTGANGSMGLKRIKEKGGTAFVQNPREAEFAEMPRNAIATGFVDEVLNVAEIPAKIIAYKNSLGKIQLWTEPEKQPLDQQQALREIFTELRLSTGHDFSNYKRPTLIRRIERRINIHDLQDLPSYVEYLRHHPEEVHALLKDLLISVTNFFRDKKAFELIETEVLPLLLKNKTREQQLRIWVAGCATGEEAYSLGILCAEKISGSIEPPKVQIFATDIDEAAVNQAREGLYSINDLADVSPERLRRFFIKEGDHYRIRREVRENIMFANHNLLKDPPFSHLDLISCRNVMIYFNHLAQERVTETFHFALNPGGFLFLGSSESIDGANDLYASFNKENHIFQARHTTAKTFPIPESVPRFQIDKTQLNNTSPQQENKVLERISFGDLHQQLLEQYAPPSLVVNEEYNIVHLTDRAARYLQISGGEISQNLLKLVPPELRLELRSALYQATQRQSTVETKGIKVNIDNKTETIKIHARPVLRAGDTAKGFMLVLFEPVIQSNEKEMVFTSDEPVAKHLEEELTHWKAQLRSSNEQHEYQQEALKASNEELQAMNEELRSAAEELETSKEELQSINEELHTLNQELKVKIEEATFTSNNLQNLINSTDIGTIFLDSSFRIVLFTPAAKNIFNLIPADYGRPLADITSRFDYQHLLEDAEQVLEKLSPAEREVNTKEGKVFQVRILPYRTLEDRINGVVITFVDVTERKAAENLIAQDLNDTQMLRELATQLTIEVNVDILYEKILNIAVALMHADAGTIHKYDSNTNELVMLTAKNLPENIKDHVFRVNAASGTSCGLSLASNELVFVNYDNKKVKDTDGSHKIHVDAGYLSAQSTPLITRMGNPIGMLTTYWRSHRMPDERELRFLDLLARQAADFMVQHEVEEILREKMEELTRFNNAMIGRETRMIELKKEVNELCKQLGEAQRYPLNYEKGNNRGDVSNK
jgi:two-component system CheB/CheR fusion protein